VADRLKRYQTGARAKNRLGVRGVVADTDRASENQLPGESRVGIIPRSADKCIVALQDAGEGKKGAAPNGAG
jgi:hypothetical protein